MSLSSDLVVKALLSGDPSAFEAALATASVEELALAFLVESTGRGNTEYWEREAAL